MFSAYQLLMHLELGTKWEVRVKQSFEEAETGGVLSSKLSN